ncbi:MAG: MMPL family transporter [Acidobacteriota bacterium]
MISLVRFSIRRPRLVLWLCAGLAIVGAALAPGIELRLDGRSLIPAGHPTMRASDAASERFGLRDVVVVALAADDGQRLGAASLGWLEDMGRRLGEIEGVERHTVASLATVPRLVVRDGVLDLKPLLARGDRTAPLDDALVERLWREVAVTGLDDGILAADDGRAAGLYALVEPEADRRRLAEAIRELVDRPPAGVRVHASGSALVQAALGEAAALDLLRLVPLVLLVVGAVLAIAFRHPLPPLVALSEVGVSLVATLGVMGALGQPVFVTTLALPVILVVIGVSDDVYALEHFAARRLRAADESAGDSALAAFEEIRGPLVTTAMTTVLGLSCLNFTELEPQRVFGTFGALSVVFSTFLTFTLVPAMLVLLAPRLPLRAAKGGAGETTETAADGRGRRFANRWAPLLRPRIARRTLAALAGVAALGLLGAAHLRIDDNWVRNLPASSRVVLDDRAINDLLAGTNTLDVELRSETERGLLSADAFAALGALEEEMLATPEVAAVDGPFSRIGRLIAGLEETDARVLRQRLLDGERQLETIEIEQALLLLDSLQRSPLPERLSADAQTGRATLFLRSADYSTVAATLEALDEAGEPAARAGVDLLPFGDGWVGFTTIRLLVVGQARSIGMALLCDLLLLALLFRSLRAAALAVAPVVFAVLTVLGTLGALGVAVGTASSMFAAIAFGIGVDYSIHLVAYIRQERAASPDGHQAVWRALAATGPAIATSAAAISAGFLVLAFSEVLPNQQLGLLISFSMLVCAVATLVFIPAASTLGGAMTENRRDS